MIWTLVIILALTVLGLFGLACGSALRAEIAITDQDYEQSLLRAAAHEQRRDHAAALAAYEDALALSETSTRTVQLDIARCLSKIGRYPEALAAYDAAIGDGGWSRPYLLRAECIREHEGDEAAIAWLDTLVREHPHDSWFRRLRGEYFEHTGRDGPASAAYAEGVEVLCNRFGFRFDTAHHLLAPVRHDPEMDRGFAALVSLLECLAITAHRVRTYDTAWAWATKAISTGQAWNARKGYLGDRAVQAGSVGGRLVRGRILADNGDIDSAAEEVTLARRLSTVTGYRGCRAALIALEAELPRAVV